jgi:DNA-binding NarL/FixJ family response regulator
MKRTRILLADDHALVRQGIRSLLSGIADFEVVGEADNGREALRLIRALAPEVALMDISMPELNGLDATAHTLREQPNLKVIILSMHATESYVLEALRAGAAGYLLKESDAAELERAIRAVSRGEHYLTPSISHHVIDRFMRGERGEKIAEADALSPRQREVLQLIAEGRSTREIAERLHVSVKTVETHRAQLMQRLEIYDVAGLTRYALRKRLIDPER